MASTRSAPSSRRDLLRREAETERTRWDPKDGELCLSRIEARGNSGGGP